MPLIEVKAFDRRFEDDEKVGALIEALTQSMVDVYGEAVREETWVVLEPVPATRWGFGGARRL